MRSRTRRGIWVGTAAALMMAAGVFAAYAGTVISSVRIVVKNVYDSSGGTLLPPEVDTGSEKNGYTVSNVDWSQDPKDWKPGRKVTGTVSLSAEDGYSFLGSYSSKKTSVSGADFISAKGDGDDESLEVKIGYYPVVQLGRTEEAGWSDTAKTRAVWKKVPYATAYQLRLYRGDDEYITTLTLEGTSVDLSGYITEQEDYHYQVRATSRDRSDARFMVSGDYVTSEDSYLNDMGELGGHFIETRDGTRYVDDKGVEASGGWRFIVGSWYYIDPSGYVARGWRLVDGKWYYLNDEGKMQTGWLNLNSKWYYLDSSGAMLTGWQQITPTDWYYFYDDGSMASGTQIDGYTVAESGKRQ